jgi:hypothetical protein
VYVWDAVVYVCVCVLLYIILYYICEYEYVGKETRTITRLFRNINITIAYKTKDTIQNHLQPKKSNTDKYKNCGIYEMKCNCCQLSYIGQTGTLKPDINNIYNQHEQTNQTQNTHNTTCIQPHNRYNECSTH